MIKYRFVNRKNKFFGYLITLVDLIGYLITRPFKKKFQFDLHNIKSITIVQLAHLGDFCLTLPLLKVLKLHLSECKINVAINRSNLYLAEKIDFIDKAIVVDAPFFSRNYKQTYFNFLKQLRNIKSDLILELRGDARIILGLKLFCSYKYCIGYNVGGLGFLLSSTLPYPFEEHISKSYFQFLYLFNIKDDPIRLWQVKDLPEDSINDLELPKNFIALQVSAGTNAKQLPLDKICTLIKAITQKYTIVLLGTNNLVSKNLNNIFKGNLNIINLIQKTTILQAIHIIKKCNFYIGMDSGLSHIASLCKKPAHVLYSGVNEYDKWKPLELVENQITFSKSNVKCSKNQGCGKLVCNNNICMKTLNIEDILQSIMTRL